MSQPIRILVADDHPMVRNCISKILESEEDLEVVGKASNGVMAIEMANALHPHVVLMDCQMPLMDGVEATQHIRKDHPEISVIGFSMHEGGRVENAMRRAGAMAYFRKGCPTDELLSAIREYSQTNAMTSDSWA
jgi:DNA-binding NarL/FixJ family response regulator